MPAGPVIFADTSQFQSYYDSTYAVPRDVVACRADAGWAGAGTDDKIVTNWRRIEADLDTGELAAFIGYVVYVPDGNAGIMQRLRNVFGATPDPRSAWMIDMESGRNFAGPGNHSTGANDLATRLADWRNSTDAVIGYANGGDWAGCWPHPPSWMPKSKRIIAGYGITQPIGYLAWQYTNGIYGNPYGYPRSSPPFGACDHNVYTQGGGLAGLLSLLGIGESVTTPAQNYEYLLRHDSHGVAGVPDSVPAPSYGGAANPTWAVQSYLVHIAEQATNALNAANTAKTAAAAAASSASAALAGIQNANLALAAMKTQNAADLQTVLTAIAAIPGTNPPSGDVPATVHFGG